MSFCRKVTEARWNDSTSEWQVDVDGKETFECDVLINACGILNNVQWPRLAGLGRFGGRICHTAAWEMDVDLKNKRVAIIGAGASAIQLLPAIQDQASHIDVYIRTPSWIIPPFAASINSENNHTYTEEEKQRFACDPVYSLTERKKMEALFNGLFKMFCKGSAEQQDMRDRLEVSMRQNITKDEYLDKLIPTFDVGCRRTSPGEPYLKALQRDHILPVFDGIDRVTSTGIMAGGTDREVDVIIAATGFDTSFRPRFPIINHKGQDLRDLWKDDPESYLGLAVSGFPNYLTFLGPNTPIANGSVLGSLESTADYFIRLLSKKIQERIVKFDVRKDAQTDFDQHTQRLMQKMVWTGSCNSWYKSKSGKITAVWPGSSLHYIQTLKSNRWEDWNWTYQQNRFDWWGQGFSDIEARDNADLAYYIEQHEPIPLDAFDHVATEGESNYGPGIEFRSRSKVENDGSCGSADSDASSKSSWVTLNTEGVEAIPSQ